MDHATLLSRAIRGSRLCASARRCPGIAVMHRTGEGAMRIRASWPRGSTRISQRRLSRAIRRSKDCSDANSAKYQRRAGSEATTPWSDAARFHIYVGCRPAAPIRAAGRRVRTAVGLRPHRAAHSKSAKYVAWISLLHRNVDSDPIALDAPRVYLR